MKSEPDMTWKSGTEIELFELQTASQAKRHLNVS